MNIIKLLCASIVTFAFRCRRIGFVDFDIDYKFIHEAAKRPS